MPPEYSQRYQQVMTLMREDPDWHPPTYRYLDASLNEVMVLQQITVLNDTEALGIFGSWADDTYVQRKTGEGLNDWYLLPFKYDRDNDRVVKFA